MHSPVHLVPKPAGHIEAMLFDGDTSDLMAVYQWIEENTQGSYDPFADMQPETGVTIDPETGFMIVKNPKGFSTVKRGDWVVRQAPSIFMSASHSAISEQYEMADGSGLPQPEPTPITVPVVDPGIYTEGDSEPKFVQIKEDV